MNNMNIWREQDLEFGNNGFLLSLSHRELSFFFFVECVDLIFFSLAMKHTDQKDLSSG